jgi:hypothetical protein
MLFGTKGRNWNAFASLVRSQVVLIMRVIKLKYCDGECVKNKIVLCDTLVAGLMVKVLSADPVLSCVCSGCKEYDDMVHRQGNSLVYVLTGDDAFISILGPSMIAIIISFPTQVSDL